MDGESVSAPQGLSAVALLVLMVVAHVLVWRLNHDLRPYVLGAVATAFLVWSILCYFAPKAWLLLMMVVPLFGISLGFMYTGDIGANKYFLEAQPPCCTGVWAIAASAQIVYRRLRPRTGIESGTTGDLDQNDTGDR